ncbi:5'-methylthioadenosine/S-adenosylhomocysteine nucleosidase [Enterococcus faecalis]|uniref:5'-methylthioadenosine/S-adenosylhomocysteine nucleosidase n=1 Tax=Enterococcus faecalis TaxID=1351 RepID=UPI00094F1DEE|nr:5'-methylthioadenosine/S-adenosylhomocysteine nucleosidase [Enterococcus faecalis]
MKLGVIAAMDLELQKLLEYFPPQRKIQLAKNTFYIYEQKTSQVIMVCAGQGKTNAKLYSQILIDSFQIEQLINIGICGCLNEKLQLFEMVLGEEYCHYDIRERQSINKFPYQLYYKGDKGMLAELQHLDEKIKCVRFGTGEGFVCDTTEKRNLIEQFSIDCVDMESAAIAQCCFLNDCAFVSIRIICDRADANAVKVTEDTQIQAMEKVFELVCAYIN